MAFLAPYMLWGALAAGIPIALHFFYRSRYRTVPWAAMKFLLTSIEQTSRRLRFQELLLLALRVAVLVLLALALARPSTFASRGTSPGDAVDAVLLLDTSYSMAARDGVAPLREARSEPYLQALRRFAAKDGGVTRFDRAKAAALAVIDHLPPNSTVQVLTWDHRAVHAGPEVPARLDQARQLIEGLTVSDLATDLSPGVRAAVAALQRGQAANKEVYIFSDMHKLAWEDKAEDTAGDLRAIREQSAVYLVRCGSRTPANVAVVNVVPPSAPRAGERADFAVLVRNSGAEAVHNLTVRLEVDGQTRDRDTKPVPKLNPGDTQAVILSGKLERAGRQVVTATLEADDLDADNRFDQVLHVRDRVGVLVVDGAPDERDVRRSASYFLTHGLYPVPAEVVTPEQASTRLLANKDVCILVNCAVQPAGKNDTGHLNTDFLKGLAAFVQEGHGLMVFPGDRVSPEAYNRLLFEQNRLLPLQLTGLHETPADKPLTLDRQSADAASPFLKFRQQDGFKSIDRIEVRRVLSVDEKTKVANETEEVRVLLRCSDGRPAVVSRRKLGQGEVLFFTTAVHDAKWNDWFLDPSFVPFIQTSLNHLLEGQPQAHNRVAGEPLRWYPPRSGAMRAYDLIQPDGQRVRLGYPKASEEGRSVPPVVEAPETPRAGVYRLVTGGAEADSVPFAVVPELRESEDLATLTAEQLDERLGFRAIHLTARDEAEVFSGADRLKREWTSWLLLALLVLVLGEAALAWFCGRAW